MTLTRILAVIGLMAVSGAANAAAIPGAVPQADNAAQSLIDKVHGDHRSCEEGAGGWHRHNRYGERLPCRPPSYGYRYEGHRPPPRRCTKDWHCEKSGPFGLEKRCYWRDLCN